MDNNQQGGQHGGQPQQPTPHPSQYGTYMPHYAGDEIDLRELFDIITPTELLSE